jgi:hypothetical protein
MAVTGLARASDGNIVLRPVWRVHEHVEVAVDPQCLLNAPVRWQLILQDDCMIDPGQWNYLCAQFFSGCSSVRIQCLQNMLSGHEHSLHIGQVNVHGATLPLAFLVVHDELEMQRCLGVPALHHLHNSITESSINTVSGTLLEPGNDDTAAQGVLMSFLHTIPHDLDDYWFADESIRETSVTQKLAVLLSERCSDEVNQMPQKSTERDRRRANCLDELP